MVKRDFEIIKPMSTEPVWCSIVFSWVSSFLLLLKIALGAVEPPCIACVQYIGGYHEYIGDIMSTLGNVQY